MKCLQILDIIAYYLSEYDADALRALNYPTQAACFWSIAPRFGKNDNYLRRLRDEYDVVTSSKRRGQCNRPPHARIVDTAAQMRGFSFAELTEIVKGLIENPLEEITITSETEKEIIPENISEDELERIVKFQDDGAAIKLKNGKHKVRVYHTNIIRQLKALYQGKCQLCGERPIDGFETDICEAHHVQYFSKTQNNDASNIMILCPNHHRFIHKLNPIFDYEELYYQFDDGKVLPVKLDRHLKR